MKSILIFILAAFLIGCAQLNLPAANPTIIDLALQIEDSTTVVMDTLQTAGGSTSPTQGIRQQLRSA